MLKANQCSADELRNIQIRRPWTSSYATKHTTVMLQRIQILTGWLHYCDGKTKLATVLQQLLSSKKCAVHIPQKLIYLMDFSFKSALSIKTYLRSQSMNIRYKPPIKKFQTKYQSDVPFHQTQTNQWNIRVKHGNSPGIIPVFFSKAVAVMNSLQF